MHIAGHGARHLPTAFAASVRCHLVLRQAAWFGLVCACWETLMRRRRWECCESDPLMEACLRQPARGSSSSSRQGHCSPRTARLVMRTFSSYGRTVLLGRYNTTCCELLAAPKDSVSALAGLPPQASLAHTHRRGLQARSRWHDHHSDVFSRLESVSYTHLTLPTIYSV